MILAIRHCDFPCFFLTFTKGCMNCIVWPKNTHEHNQKLTSQTQSMVLCPFLYPGEPKFTPARCKDPSAFSGLGYDFGGFSKWSTFSRGVWNILEPSWNHHEPSAQSWRYDKTPLRKSFSDQFLVGVHQQTEQKPGECPKEQSQQTTIWQSDI